MLSLFILYFFSFTGVVNQLLSELSLAPSTLNLNLLFLLLPLFISHSLFLFLLPLSSCS